MIDEINDIDAQRIGSLSGETHKRRLKEVTVSKTKKRGRKRMFAELWSKEPGFKEEFLNFLKNDTQLKQKTLNNYRIFLYRISNYEINQMNKEKDLYEFTNPEIETMIRYCRFSRFKSAQSFVSLINKYLKYASNKGIIKNRLKVTYNPTQEEINSLLINKITQKKQLVTRKELYDVICPRLANYQDKLSWILPFEGLTYYDMINLKEKDVDSVNNTITLTDRILHVSQKTMHIIKEGMDQGTYYRGNGKTKSPLWLEVELTPTKYVIKPTEKVLEGRKKNLPSNIDDIKVDSQLIARRVYRTRDDEEIQKEHVSISTLRESGILECLEENKEILTQSDMTIEDFQQVLYNRFGKFKRTQLEKIRSEYMAKIQNTKQ